MIKDLQKIIFDSLKGKNDIAPRDVTLSKFYHGSRERHKVIFLATDKYRPIALLKIVRTPDQNKLLKEELLIMKELKGSDDFCIPEIYAEGEYRNLFYFVEEFASGDVLTKQKAKDHLDLILKFQLSQKKKGELKLIDLLGQLSQSKIKHVEFEDLLHFVVHMEHDMNLYYSSSHGDLTYKNVIVKPDGKGLTFIDWEKGNQRSLWGLDFCHYLIRCGHDQKKNGFIQTINTLCDEKIFKQISKQDLVVMCALDRMLDIMEKQFPGVYSDFIKRIKFKI